MGYSFSWILCIMQQRWRGIMRLIKQPARQFNTDTLLAAPYWEALRPGDGYAYDTRSGSTLISAPENTAISAPENALIAYLGDGSVILAPDVPGGGQHYKRRRWHFRNVKVRQAILDEIKNGHRQIKMDGARGGDYTLNAAEILRGEVFAGAGYHRWPAPYTFAVSLEYKDKDGVDRYHDPVNAINYWLTHRMDLPDDRSWV
jgi:hypothetical protein